MGFEVLAGPELGDTLPQPGDFLGLKGAYHTRLTSLPTFDAGRYQSVSIPHWLAPLSDKAKRRSR
jgi:hypothetical protein